MRNRATLEWWEGGVPRSSPARLIDISRGGVLLSADSPPPMGGAIWIRLEEPAGTDWVRALAVRRDEAQRTALSFEAPCPFDFYQAAVLGIGFGGAFG